MHPLSACHGDNMRRASSEALVRGSPLSLCPLQMRVFVPVRGQLPIVRDQLDSRPYGEGGPGRPVPVPFIPIASGYRSGST